MSQLARFSSDVDTLTTDRCDEIIAHVIELGPDDTAQAFQQAKAYRALADGLKATKRLRVDLTRVEIWILWRLGRLKHYDPLSTHEKTCARAFRELKRGPFEASLAQYLRDSDTVSPGGFRLWLSGTGPQPRRWHDHVTESQLDTAIERSQWEFELRGIAQETRRWVGELLNTGAPVEVSASTTQFFEEHDLDPTPAEWLGVREAIRQAVLSDDTKGNEPSDYLWESCPEFVTIKTDRGGWLHKPIRTATLEELAWMIAYRHEQVERLQFRIQALQRCHDAFVALGASERDELGGFMSGGAP